MWQHHLQSVPQWVLRPSCWRWQSNLSADSEGVWMSNRPRQTSQLITGTVILNSNCTAWQNSPDVFHSPSRTQLQMEQMDLSGEWRRYKLFTNTAGSCLDFHSLDTEAAAEASHLKSPPGGEKAKHLSVGKEFLSMMARMDAVPPPKLWPTITSLYSCR